MDVAGTATGKASRGWCAAVTAIALAGFALRLAGVAYDLPLLTHPDEKWLVESALTMLRTGDWNPHFFHYPTLPIYLLTALFAAFGAGAELFGFVASSDELPLEHFYLVARAVVALEAAATIVVVADLGRRGFGERVGACAGALVAASLLHVTSSIYSTVDVPMTFFASASLWAMLRVHSEGAGGARGPSVRRSLLAGALIGCAIGTKYTAAFLGVPFVLAHVLARPRAWRAPAFWAGLAAIPVVFLATMPIALLEPRTLVDALASLADIYANQHVEYQSELPFSFFDYVLALARDGLGPLATVFAVVGAAVLWRRQRSVALVTGALVLALMLLIGRYPVFFDRNALSAMPVLALWAALGVERVAAACTPRAKRRTLVTLAFCALAVGAIGARSVDWIRVQRLPDTRALAHRWLREHAEPGARIVFDAYCTVHKPWLANYALEWATPPKFASLAARTDVDFVVLCSLKLDAVARHPERKPELVRAYEDFCAARRPLVEFVEDRESCSGPTVRIYALREPRR